MRNRISKFLDDNPTTITELADSIASESAYTQEQEFIALIAGGLIRFGSSCSTSGSISLDKKEEAISIAREIYNEGTTGNVVREPDQGSESDD